MNPKKINNEIISLEQSKAILNGLQDGVIIVDLKGIILFANAVCSKLFGKHVDQLIGQNFGFPIELNLQQEIEIESAAGAYQTLQVLSNKITWGKKKVFLLSLRNITTQKELARKLEKAHEELENSYTELTIVNQDLKNFNSIAVHDLKAPLRSIIGFSSILLLNESKFLDSESKSHLEYIIKASNRMSVLIDDLLTLSTISNDKSKFVSCNLNQLVSELLETLNPDISELDGTVQVGKLPIILCIPGLVKQVFQNLILNSLKFHIPGKPPFIRIRAKNQNSNFQITLEDNGIGFSNKFAKDIFEPFQRLENSKAYPGSGIGLSIVKKIMDIHKGTVSAQSEMGKGSRFILEFPSVKSK